MLEKTDLTRRKIL